MTVAHASSDDIARYAAALGRCTWPLTRSAMLAIGESLGWSVRSDRDTGITFRSGLPFRFSRVDTLLRGEEVSEITINITDRVDDEPVEVLAPTIATAINAVAGVLGDPSGQRNTPKATYWDLPSGARLSVDVLGTSATLSVLSPRYAGVERDEERLGIDPARVASAGQD